MRNIFFLSAIFLFLFSGCTQVCTQGARCKLIPETGDCDAAFLRFYYDQESQTCQEFVWGGCDGVVPFETLEACQADCECDD